MVTMGRLRGLPPIEPRNGAPPKAKTPPAGAGSHEPALDGTAAALGPEPNGTTVAAPARPATAAGRNVSARRALSHKRRERSGRVRHIVVPDRLRVALGREKRPHAASTQMPRF